MISLLQSETPLAYLWFDGSGLSAPRTTTTANMRSLNLLNRHFLSRKLFVWAYVKLNFAPKSPLISCIGLYCIWSLATSDPSVALLAITESLSGEQILIWKLKYYVPFTRNEGRYLIGGCGFTLVWRLTSRNMWSLVISDNTMDLECSKIQIKEKSDERKATRLFNEMFVWREELSYGWKCQWLFFLLYIPEVYLKTYGSSSEI